MLVNVELSIRGVPKHLFARVKAGFKIRHEPLGRRGNVFIIFSCLILGIVYKLEP